MIRPILITVELEFFLIAPKPMHQLVKTVSLNLYLKKNGAECLGNLATNSNPIDKIQIEIYRLYISNLCLIRVTLYAWKF